MNKGSAEPLVFGQIEYQIERGKLALLAQQNPATFISANLVSPVLIAVFLGLTGQPLGGIIAWVSFGILVCVSRALHHREFRQFHNNAKSPKQWEFELLMFSTISGLFWAGAAILFVSPDNPGLSVVVIVAIFAHLSAAVPSHATHIRIYIAFSFSLWLPTCLFFIFMNSIFYYGIAVLGSVFVLVNLSFASNQARSVNQSLRLRYENLQLLNELKRQKLIAEEANLAKSRFLAAASHDLRQPLHAMGLFADGLTQRVAQPESRRILSLLKGSMDTLRDLFDSLLDISRLDAGVIQPQNTRFDLSLMLERLANEYEFQTAAKGLELRRRRCCCWINSDPVLVEQILRNLIWNAIKYTETGGILLSMRKRGGKVRVEIWDTGSGIKQSDQQQIFQEFHQVHNSKRDRSQGIGLGLSIVQRTSRLLGFELGMQSDYGRGSRFYIDVDPVAAPVPIIASPDSTRAFDRDLKGVSVLVVDDEADICSALEILLRGWGCQVQSSDSLNGVKAVLEEFSPDILLTDYRLQDQETGDMIIREVQEAMGYEIPSFIITGTIMDTALHAAGQPGQRQGVEILYKPLSSEALLKKMIDALNSQ